MLKPIIHQAFPSSIMSSSTASTMLLQDDYGATQAALLPPLKAAVVMCRSRAGVGAVEHFVSDFLDYGVPAYWSVPRSCERGDLRLLTRLLARAALPVDPYYRALLVR